MRARTAPGPLLFVRVKRFSQARGGERLENKSVTAAVDDDDDISKACKI
jgi:hypothetical protein